MKWSRLTWNEIWSLIQDKGSGLSAGHPCTDSDGNLVTVAYVKEITNKVVPSNRRQYLELLIDTLLTFRPADNLFENDQL